MDTLSSFLDSQPFIALFLVIGLGYAVGKISIAGFSLGIGAVLFVGLAVGAIAPQAAPPSLIGLIGLVLFLYGIGIQYGKDFFKGLAARSVSKPTSLPWLRCSPVASPLFSQLILSVSGWTLPPVSLRAR